MLTIDIFLLKNRDGKITRKEFRELLEKFTFRLDDRQFKELMTRVDPDHNPRVDYHTFLRLFEEKETKVRFLLDKLCICL